MGRWRVYEAAESDEEATMESDEERIGGVSEAREG
jgi:hypothetical protein